MKGWQKMIDTATLTDLRNYIKRRAGYFRYRVGSTFYKAEITDALILNTGVVRIQASIVPTSPVTINRVELWSNAGELWAHKDVNISIDAGQTGVLYWFDLTLEIKEDELNVRQNILA